MIENETTINNEEKNILMNYISDKENTNRENYSEFYPDKIKPSYDKSEESKILLTFNNNNNSHYKNLLFNRYIFFKLN